MTPAELSRLGLTLQQLAAELREDPGRDGEYTLVSAAGGLVLRLAGAARKPAQRTVPALRPLARVVRR